MAYISRGLLSFAAALSLAACGSSLPGTPSPSGLQAPTGFRIVSQRVTLNDNEIVVAWSGAAPGYRVEIGSGVNRSDVRSVDVATTSYTFVAPRTANAYYARVMASDGAGISAPTSELTIVTLDLRHIIDALFFRAGPMSEGRAIQPGNIRAGVWPDGTHLRILVSNEAGERIRSLMQAAVDDYASVVGGAVTGNAELVSDDMHSLTRAEQLAPFTIVTRILKGQCGNGCANYGPAPLGPNASIVTLDSTAVTNAVAHELGHAYGLAHLLNPDSGRPEFRFLMNPIAGGPNFTETEKTAIAAARAGGIRAGTTRDEALARDLVSPYFVGAHHSFLRHSSMAEVGARLETCSSFGARVSIRHGKVSNVRAHSRTDRCGLSGAPWETEPGVMPVETEAHNSLHNSPGGVLRRQRPR